MNSMTGSTARTSVSPTQILEMASDGITLLAEHESAALENLWQGMKAHAIVAKKARGLGELLRDQIDLLPDTQATVLRDHQLRRALIDGLVRDFQTTLTRDA